MDLEGSVVEFTDSGALRIGYVRRREHRKIQIVDARGRQSTVPISRVVVVHETVREEDFPAAAARIQERIDAHVSEIDTCLLWESAGNRPREFSISELARTYFGQAFPEHESAICHKLANETLYFRRTAPGGFEPRSASQVAAERLRMTREEESERQRQEVTRILRRAIEGPPEAMLSEEGWTEILERLERWLRQNDANEVGRTIEKIVGEAGAREAAYDLLRRYGHLTQNDDRFLLIRGLPTTFSADLIRASEDLPVTQPTGNRERYFRAPTLAIDDEYTVEVDDAITAFEEDGVTRVGIHIADVSSFVGKDDALDREAHRRSSTIYLPNISVMMFPPRLATDLASLVPGETRPALTLEARFSKTGTLLDFRFFRSIISVTERMGYARADEAVRDGNPTLNILYRIAQVLRSERVSQGAQTHLRPDIKVHVRNDRICVKRLEADTPSRFIVSEMMILANRLAAEHAASTGIPIIFRTQEPPRDPRPETEGLPEAIQFELLRRSFKRSRLSLYPSPHAGLGLSRYTQMSSPIRRYADLVTQRQFTAALEGNALPYEREELLELMTSCEAREIEIRRLEQTSTNWWILTYLSREGIGRPHEAVVVDKKGTVELNDFLVRARLNDIGDLDPGDPVTVEIEFVDPEHGELRLLAHR